MPTVICSTSMQQQRVCLPDASTLRPCSPPLQDLARLFVWTMREYDSVEPIILSVPEEDEVPIGDVVHMIAKASGYQGQIKVTPAAAINLRTCAHVPFCSAPAVSWRWAAPPCCFVRRDRASLPIVVSCGAV